MNSKTVAILTNEAIAAGGSKASPVIDLRAMNGPIVKTGGEGSHADGFGSLQWSGKSGSGVLVFDIEFSLDGQVWFTKQSVAASAVSGLESLSMVFAAYMRVTARETGGTQTVTASASVMVG